MGCFKAGRALSGGLKGCRCAGAATTSALCTVMLCTVHCEGALRTVQSLQCALYTVQEQQAPALRSIFLQLLKGEADQVRLRRCCSTCSFALSLLSLFHLFTFFLLLEMGKVLSPSSLRFYVVLSKMGPRAMFFELGDTSN